MNLEAELRRLRHALQELDWQFTRNSTRGPLASLGQSVTTAGSYARDAWRENRSRVDRIREALEASGPLAQSRVVQMFSNVDLSSIWDILISLCKDIALYYGGSVLTGAAVGGAIGAFAGGVGAAPGAAVGAGAGAKAGLWVLALLGLRSLAEDLIDKIPKMLQHYEQGIKTAWGASTPRWHERGQCVVDNRSDGCFFAASELAQGHVILIAGLIMALTAYLTRGRGDRSALLKEVAESPRLGPRVATWLEQNAERLAKPQGSRTSYGPRAGGPAVTPSQLRKEMEAQRKRQSRAVNKENEQVGSKILASKQLKAGTLEHKADRWQRYKDRGGKKEYQRWSKQYDANIRNNRRGLARESEYRASMGGVSGRLKTPLKNRQIDILKADEMYAGQVKTGPVSLTKENALAIQKDAELVKRGWQVEHILEQGASKPYLRALEKAEIYYHIGPKMP